jgi:hypothetical protein
VSALGAGVRQRPQTDAQGSFELALGQLREKPGFAEKYPDLHNWLSAVEDLRSTKPEPAP